MVCPLMREAARRSTLCLVIALSACGGGGGGGGGGSGSGGMQLVSVEFGRLLTTEDGDQVVSPLTTVRTDPISGLDDPDTLQELTPQTDPQKLVPFALGPNFVPPVVPRNAVLVLRFDRTLDPASLVLDTLSASGTVIRPGSVQVRHATAKSAPPRGVPVDVEVRGSRLWIRTVTESAQGLPASPLSFGPNGEPRADATGFLRLMVPGSGGPTLRALTGEKLQERADSLGESWAPIGFNPGNALLDFIAEGKLAVLPDTFNGFLPDRDAPRIMREHTYQAKLDTSAGDSADAFGLRDASAQFDTMARQGLGEWAGGFLVLRPGKAKEEMRRIARNTLRQVFLERALTVPPANGDVFRLVRAEYHEPDPGKPIDPLLFDPNNPENARNTQLSNFLDAHEIDAAGQPVGAPWDVTADLPAFSGVRVRFSEPLDLASLLPWETLQVTADPDPGFGEELLTHLVVSPRQDEVRILPALVQANGSERAVGWGPGRRALRLSLHALPELAFLRQFLSPTDLDQFLATGPRGLTDLAGRGLAFAPSQFDPADPVIRHSHALVTDESISSTVPPPPAEDWGVIVHRFLGIPEAGTDAPTGKPGARFLDQQDHYLPLADVHLPVNGYLAAQPVTYVSKIHDDFFPPPDGGMGAFPFGVSFPLTSFQTVPPPFEHNGARFQHVFRDVDASPGSNLKGTLLDLYRVSFAPIGGGVNADVYENVSVHAAHSYIRPFLQNFGGSPAEPFFGLHESFDFNSYRNTVLQLTDRCPGTLGRPPAPNVYDKSTVTVVPAGTRWMIQPSRLYRPPGDPNSYHPWPEFTTRFQYNNGDYPEVHSDQRRKINNQAGPNTWVDRDILGAPFGMTDLGDSLLIEYRIRPQATFVSGRNGFTFSPAIPTSGYPYFRAYSLGEPGNVLDPDNGAGDVRARCATRVASTPFGDGARYFSVFDYVKTTSVITSPYVNTLRTGAPAYSDVIVQPPLDTLAGLATITFEGATGAAGGGGQGFTADPSDHDGMDHLAFRVRLEGTPESMVTPALDLVAVPYRRD